MSRIVLFGAAIFAALAGIALIDGGDEAQAGLRKRGCGGCAAEPTCAVVETCAAEPACGGRVGLLARLKARKAACDCAAEPTCCEPEPTCCEPEPACGGRVGLLAKLKARRAAKACGCEAEPTCCEPAPVCCEPVCDPCAEVAPCTTCGETVIESCPSCAPTVVEPAPAPTEAAPPTPAVETPEKPVSVDAFSGAQVLLRAVSFRS